MPQPPVSRASISAEAASAILAAAKAARPHEGCGLLFGHAGHIAEASAAKNIASAPACRFEIDPAALFAAHRRARAGPLALVGCWHSHPDGNPEPSALDAAGVADTGWIWLIEARGALAAYLPDAGAPAGFRRLILAVDAPPAM